MAVPIFPDSQRTALWACYRGLVRLNLKVQLPTVEAASPSMFSVVEASHSPQVSHLSRWVQKDGGGNELGIKDLRPEKTVQVHKKELKSRERHSEYKESGK